MNATRTDPRSGHARRTRIAARSGRAARALPAARCRTDRSRPRPLVPSAFAFLAPWPSACFNALRGLALLLLVALAGGCDGAASGGDAAPAVVLRVANWSGPGNDPRFLSLVRELDQEFERRHPGAKVQIEQIPGRGVYEAKLMMMILSGNAPDVIQFDASSGAVFIDNGVLADLTPLIRGDPVFDPNDYFPQAFDVARRGEAVYAVPLDFTPMVMFYNRRLFDAAGVPHPREGWTWDDFLETARKLTLEAAPGRPKQYGFNLLNHMPHWVMWLWNNGGDVVTPDGRHAAGAFDSPASIEAVRFLSDLALRHRVAPTPSEAAAAGVDLFLAEQAAMHLTGHWELIEYGRRGLDVGIVGLPSNLPRPQTVMYVSGLSLTRGARNPDLAWKYIRFITSADVQIRRVTAGLTDPNERKPALAISGNRRAAEYYAAHPLEQAFLAQIPNCRRPIGSWVERYGVCEDLGREMLDDILRVGVPADEAARRAARLMEASLRE